MINNINFNALANKIGQILDISRKEALVYLTLFRLGKQSVSVIGKHLGINRTTMSSVLERLWQKGLVRKHPSFGSVIYTVCSFDELKKSFDLKIDLIQEKKDDFNNIIPHLKKLPIIGLKNTMPTVSYFEGVSQSQYALLNILRSVPIGGEILGYVNVASRDQPHFKDFWKDYYNERIKRKILMRQISPDTKTCLDHAKKDKDELRETIIIPFKKFQFIQNFEINILPDSFATINLQPNFSMVTLHEDKNASQAMRTIFDNHWNCYKSL